MVFSSPLFLFAFLPVALAGYVALPRKARLPFLLLANLIFYGWGEPVYLLLMLAVTLANYAFGLLIGRAKQRGEKGRARLLLILSVAFSLGALGYFKYAGFLAGIWNGISFLPRLPRVQVELPIGISFYTFQAMSYAVDVYRGDAPVQKNALTFGVYVTLFPQLIAGPIVRYKDVSAQLTGRRADAQEFALGIRVFLAGLCKKVLLANQMGLLWDALRPLAATNGVLAAWVGLIAYSLQIYFDFSGYSDMAIGLGHMLGLTFLKNFDYPYISRSVTEFWRRWHISLSSWFRDYVYIPLGGNRAGRARTFLNLFAVWLLTGLWHGASWNFVLWGLYYFLLLSLEKLFLGRLLEQAPSLLRHAYTLFAVALGWALFYFDGGALECLRYISHLFTGGLLPGQDAANWILRYLPLLLTACVCATPLGSRLWKRAEGTRLAGPLSLALCALALILCTAALVSQSYNPFLYFKF